MALGGNLESLHPRLRAYFGEIPRGSVGEGSGVFDIVGTPRRWLWPVLWALGRWMLEIGSAVIQTETELVLKSRCRRAAGWMASGCDPSRCVSKAARGSTC